MTVAIDTVAGGRTDGAAPAARRWSWTWLGLLPFLAFLFLFLLLPTVGIVEKAFTDVHGSFSTSAFTDAFHGEWKSFWGSLKVSLITALLGVVFGGLLAYAVATARRPKWLRSLVASFSGVAANMGGVVLAFMFFTLVGRQGLATKLVTEAGWDPYAHGFSINDFWGWVVVYMYFQIPLMVLVILPAIDGLQQSWREAAANLGANSFTYWRRVGLPVLAPSLLGSFLLLFANSFSAFATAYALNTTAQLLPVRIRSYLQNDVSGQTRAPFALAAWMIIIIAVAMTGYLLLRKRAERWQR